MSAVPSKTERNTLARLHAYRFLTNAQVAALTGCTGRTARKRVDRLRADGFVTTVVADSSGRRGRPESVARLTQAGLAQLGSSGAAGGVRGSAAAAVDDVAPRGHDLLVNWVRIHVEHIERAVPRLQALWLAPNGSAPASDQRDALGRIPLPGPGRSSATELVPDGIFTLGNRVSGKQLLFFVEVDRGTEPLKSRSAGRQTVAGKLDAYRAVFRGELYRRYEQACGARLRGFRLLLLTEDAAALPGLCRHVTGNTPSDFVWVASMPQLMQHGLGAAIWARGGNQAAPPESIIGPTLSQPTPLPRG